MQFDFRQALTTITKQVVTLADQTPLVIVLIDGRAGSGKSTLAAELKEQLFKELEYSPRVIHMDDLYPGWEGLRAGSQYLLQNVLLPLQKATEASWQIWDWETGERGASDLGNGWRFFSAPGVLIVEGCGSISRASSELAQLTVWIESDAQTRRERWESRDGGRFNSFWNAWSAQEDEFYQEERASQLAQITVLN
ncbi:MAG: hypothetical protein RL068_978 [Actinomycetota bacterium]|jgi:uridine kinase